MSREHNLITTLAALVVFTVLAQSCANNAEQCEQTGQCKGEDTGGAGGGGTGGSLCPAGVSCDDGNPCTDDSCDPGSGCVNSPVAAATTLCEGGVCDQSGQCGPCGADAPCPETLGCSPSGLCLLVDGTACQSGGQCQSDHCVDGVCCDTPCDGECQACKLSAPDTEAGTCRYVLAGQDDSTCPSPNSCNGSGDCQRANGESCGVDDDCLSGNCDGGTCG